MYPYPPLRMSGGRRRWRGGRVDRRCPRAPWPAPARAGHRRPGTTSPHRGDRWARGTPARRGGSGAGGGPPAGSSVRWSAAQAGTRCAAGTAHRQRCRARRQWWGQWWGRRRRFGLAGDPQHPARARHATTTAGHSARGAAGTAACATAANHTTAADAGPGAASAGTTGKTTCAPTGTSTGTASTSRRATTGRRRAATTGTGRCRSVEPSAAPTAAPAAASTRRGRRAAAPDRS